MSTADDDSMADVGIGPPTAGVPMPRAGGFIGRLRRNLERLEVGMFCELVNVDIKQERYIRSRVPQLGAEMACKFSVRVASKKRDRSSKRTLSVWRIE
jgi:hypothetical protein